jgi:hypothetical protein
LRSPLGVWGSIIGLVCVIGALLQTWLYPLINLASGLACVALLTIAYFVLRSGRRKRASAG